MKKAELQAYQVLMLFSLLVFLFVLIYVFPASDKAKDAYQDMNDKFAIYKTEKNLFTIHYGQEAGQLLLFWTKKPEQKDIKSYKIFIRPGKKDGVEPFEVMDPGSKSEHDNYGFSCKGSDSDRSCDFWTFVYKEGQNMRNLVSSSYDIIIECYTEGGTKVGVSKTTAHFVAE